MKKTKSMLVLLLVCCLVISGFSGVTVAANEYALTNVDSSDNAVCIDNVVSLEHLLTDPPQQDIIVPLSEDPCHVLRYVDHAEFEKGNHIARLPNEETLSSYVFLNEDGSKTAYWIDKPVKFRDTDGIIQEKDLSLKSSPEGYVTSKNNVQLTLPTNPVKGIRLSYSDTTVSLIPQGGSTNIEVEATDNSVTYVNYYGNGMSLRYTPTSSGVKEDILLQAYYGINSFTFMLHTGGLNVYQSNGNYYVAASQMSTERILLGDVVSYDAKAKFSMGTMTSETITAGQLYRITITVDESFLTDNNTIYPVTIDPTLTVSYGNNGDDYIVDAPIFEGYPSNNYGAFQYNRVGYVDASYQSGRTVVKLPQLTDGETYLSLNASEITSVKFYVKEATGSSGISVSVYPLTDNSTWTESSITWGNVGGRASTATATGTLTDSAWTAFDITTLVRQWKVGTYNAGCGFIMIGANEDNTDKAFCASEHSTTSYRPYLVMTYNADASAGGNNFETAEAITSNSSITVTTAIVSELAYFKFTPSTTQEYLFYSNNAVGDPKILVYDANQTLLGSNDDGAGNKNFRYAATLTAGQTYYLAMGHYGSNTGSYTVNILTPYSLSNGIYHLCNEGTGYYLDIHGPTAQELVHQWEFHTGEQLKWTFTKGSDGFYTIRSQYGDKKYVGISSTSVGFNNVVLLSSITDYAKWKILKDKNGNLYFEPKAATGKTLCVPDSTMGTELQLAYLGASNLGRNTWDVVGLDEMSTHVHSYTANTILAPTHPHKITWTCECGASYGSYPIYSTCSTCTAYKTDNTWTAKKPFIFSYPDGDAGMGIGVFVTINCYIEYSNSYTYPFSMTYNYPPFASFVSCVNSYADIPSGVPSVTCTAKLAVHYYSSSDELIATQDMAWGVNGTFNSHAAVSNHAYTLDMKPAYVVTGASFMMAAGADGYNYDITAYFP